MYPRQLDQQMIKALHKKQGVLIPPIHVNTSIEAAIQYDEFVKVRSSS